VPLDTLGSQFIAYDLKLAGNGSMRLTHAPATTKFSVVDTAARAIFRYDAAGNSLGSSGLADARPQGIVSNVAGDTLWVIDADTNVYVYAAAGAFLGSWSAQQLVQPQDIATDGTDVWILDGITNRVYHYANAAGRTSGTQVPVDSFALDSANTMATGLVVNGGTIWVTDNQASQDRVYVYSTAGANLGSWVLDAANTNPTGITLNPAGGSDMWVVDRGTAKIFHYSGATAWRSGTHSASDTFALTAGNTQAEGIADPPAETPSPVGSHPSKVQGAKGDRLTMPVIEPSMPHASLAVSSIVTQNTLATAFANIHSARPPASPAQIDQVFRTMAPQEALAISSSHVPSVVDRAFTPWRSHAAADSGWGHAGSPPTTPLAQQHVSDPLDNDPRGSLTEAARGAADLWDDTLALAILLVGGGAVVSEPESADEKRRQSGVIRTGVR
jgi:hypothetical protein